MLEGKPHELATALYPGPIVELVTVGGHWVTVANETRHVNGILRSASQLDGIPPRPQRSLEAALLSRTATPFGRHGGQFAISAGAAVCDSSGLNLFDELEAIMALEIRPNCEYCDRDLPAGSTDARICTYECTFCADCVETKLHDVCPNCGGAFAPRPVRPAGEWRPGLSLARRPASGTRVHLSYGLGDIAALIARVKDIAPENR